MDDEVITDCTAGPAGEPVVSSHKLGFVSLEYFGTLVGGWYRGGSAALRICQPKAWGPVGLGL